LIIKIIGADVRKVELCGETIFARPTPPHGNRTNSDP
jgi:hypothetical protein